MKLRDIYRDTRGNVAVVGAIFLCVALALAALAIDYGHLQSVYAKMKSASDAGALAGVSRIFALNDGTLVVKTNARDIVRQVIAENHIPLDEGKTALEIPDADIVFGKWDFTARQFASTVDPAASPSATSIDTCQVTIKKNQTYNGRVVNRFYSGPTALTAVSRAYIGYAGKIPEGGAFPLVVYEDFLQDIQYGEDHPVVLTTNSDQDDNCGYTTFADKAGHANLIKEFVKYANDDGGTAPPAIQKGDYIWLNNGDHANVYNYLQDAQPGWPEGKLEVVLPVVRGGGDDQKFTHTHEVVDFVRYVITNVISPGQGQGHENHGQGQTHPHRYEGYFQQAKVDSNELPGQTGNYGLRTIGTALIP